MAPLRIIKQDYEYILHNINVVEKVVEIVRKRSKKGLSNEVEDGEKVGDYDYLLVDTLGARSENVSAAENTEPGNGTEVDSKGAKRKGDDIKLNFKDPVSSPITVADSDTEGASSKDRAAASTKRAATEELDEDGQPRRKSLRAPDSDKIVATLPYALERIAKNLYECIMECDFKAENSKVQQALDFEPLLESSSEFRHISSLATLRDWDLIAYQAIRCHNVYMAVCAFSKKVMPNVGKMNIYL